MMGSIGKNILTGLITILPVVLTLYLLYWLVVSTENVLGDGLRHVLPSGVYQPGMGVATGVLVAFSVGLLMHTLVMQQLLRLSERIFYRLPLVKSVYLALRDFLDYFSPEKKKDFQQVVAVTLGDTRMQLIGFVTQSDPGQLPGNFSQDDAVLVYLPMSYMIGGYAVLVPRSAVRPLDMSMEAAMRFILTAGVTGAPAPAERSGR
jgi:uncharacterized membrane protein